MLTNNVTCLAGVINHYNPCDNMKCKPPDCHVMSWYHGYQKPYDVNINVFKENICLSIHVYLSNITLETYFSYLTLLMCFLFFLTDYKTDVMNERFCIWDITMIFCHKRASKLICKQIYNLYLWFWLCFSSSERMIVDILKSQRAMS